MKILTSCVVIALAGPSLATIPTLRQVPTKVPTTTATATVTISTTQDESIEQDSWQCATNTLESSYDGPYILTLERPGWPERTYRIYTPVDYNSSSTSSKLVLSFHGWCGNGSEWTEDASIQQLTDEYNNIIVAPDGLGGDDDICNSWSFPGSTTGLGQDGITTTCNTDLGGPDHCYASCGDNICQNRCAWTHCEDDDVQFVQDLLVGDANFTNALPDVLCFDPNQVYVMGASNGGMMTWSLLQDNRTAPLFVAAAPMIGLPHCGYDLPGTVPVISLVSKDDDTVSPSNLPYPGSPADGCVENRDGEGYRFVSSHHMTSAFAEAGGCLENSTAQPSKEFPTLEYDAGSDKVQCKTWCPGSAPFAIDCAFSAGHWTPDYVYEAAFGFFEAHSIMNSTRL